jgi:hypothetical protein
VVVMGVDDYAVEAGHKYTFTAKAMPWAHYCEICGKRIEVSFGGRCEFHKLEGDVTCQQIQMSVAAGESGAATNQ